MPVVIDELVITIEVGGAEKAGGNSPTTVAAGASSSTSDRAALVSECVERVLEILRDRREP